MKFKEYLPHVIAVLIFLIVAIVFASPAIKGKQIMGHDTESFIGMSKEATDYNKTHDDQALWTNSMFGGMPTYQICMDQPYTIIKYIAQVVNNILPRPISQILLYLIGFYILLLAFKVPPYLAIGGSIAFAFGSYNLIILVAGHNTKALAIAYMAPIIGSIHMAFNGKKWIGSTLLALFLGLGIYVNHIQITYYTLFIVICYGISELIIAICNKQYKEFFTTIGILCIGALIAIGLNSTRLLTTQEYAKATMRGDSNGLTIIPSGDSHGLDKEYITAWSYGIGESFTLLIPNYNGGASGGLLSTDSETAQTIKQLTGSNDTQLEKQMKDFMVPLYWGSQPFTSGPVYAGAIICFLFVLGLMIVPGRERWWLLAATIVGLVLSWGKNFMPITDFFIDYIPMYDKFRSVSMTLTITCFTMALMAMLALKEILFNNSIENKKKLTYIYISGGITAGLCLLFWLAPSMAGDFKNAGDAQYTGSYQFLQTTLPIDRAALLSTDALRSFLLISTCAIVLIASIKLKRFSSTYIVAAIALLLAIDMIPIAQRYLNDDNFVTSKNIKDRFNPTLADQYILQDKDKNFRTINLNVNTFNSSAPSYFYKTVGGYSAVKLRRIQELIEVQISPELMKIQQGFANIKTLDQAQALFNNTPVLNMLNTKYLVYNDNAQPILNTQAYGNAWLVNNIKIVDNADQEMLALNSTDLKNTMIVDKEFKDLISQTTFNKSNASILLKDINSNQVTYSFSADSKQAVVFSEAYYYTGWNVYINDKLVPHFRANYMLRAMCLDAGQYDIVFKFEPKSYTNGNYIAIICSILLTLAFLGIIFVACFRKKNNELKVS